MPSKPTLLHSKKRQRQSFGFSNEDEPTLSYTYVILAASFTALLLATSKWAVRWLLSGSAVESLLLVFGASSGTRIFKAIPLWSLLAALNLIYAICSTSWLLFGVFAMLCWPSIVITCLFQASFASDFARKNLRKVLKDVQFTRDRIALFNLPALEIDTEVAGLLVVRGVTINLSNLSMVVHGVEVGIKLADEIELALHTDEVDIALFRHVKVGDVYGNIKGGKAEMTFAEVEDDESIDDDFFTDTPLLRAAAAGSDGIKDRPHLRDSLTGGSYIKDSSAKAGFAAVQSLSPDDEAAEEKYEKMLREIRTTSVVYQGRAKVRRAAKEKGIDLSDEKDIRAGICAELHDTPSVPHPPQRSVKVTTLQKMSSLRVKTLMHRLPFLLRLLLSPLGYFHPITFSSINAAGSGQWLRELLQKFIFKTHAENSAEIRRLERRMGTWLSNANFCVQLTDIDGLGQVPMNSSLDIVAYLHFADIIAYRTMPESGILTQVVRLGGADATFSIPSFLLPHHEHLLPPRPSAEDKRAKRDVVKSADGIPQVVQAEHELELVEKDETTMSMSVHGSLPAAFDQSLLQFVAALVKATKIIEFDKEVDKVSNRDIPTPGDSESFTPKTLSRTTTNISTNSETDSIVPLHKRVLSDITGSTSPTAARFKNFTKNLQQNLREVSVASSEVMSKDALRDFVKDVHQSTRDNMKKAVVGSMVNDRWIAKLVGKIAANLERAQGDVGYSGSIPVPLEPYRPGPGHDGLLSKILP